MILGSISALAQDQGGGGEGPIVVGERPELESFRFYNVSAGLELSTTWRGDYVRATDGAKSRREELEFRESLDLSSKAYVLHPNFLDIDLFGRFGAQQFRTSGGGGGTGFSIEVDDRRDWTFDYLLEHDVQGVFLGQTRVPLTLHTRRSQSLLYRQFGETLETITSEHGARLTFRSVPFPTELAYIRREQDTTSRLRTTDFSIEQDTFRWDTQYNPTSNQFFTWRYSYDEVRQSGFLRPTQSFRRHNAQLGHTIDFGEDQQHQLRSLLTVFHEDGALELTRVRLHEALRLRHTPRFETRYNYTLDYTERPGRDQLLHSGSAGFRHRLFESLTSIGTVGASRLSLSDGTDFTSDQVFGDLGLRYNKRIPYGTLAADTGISYSRQDDSERNGTIRFIQEPRTFSPGGIVMLQRRRIIPESIVIMDAAGIFTFTPGFDYTVQPFGDRVEIRRVLGGDIVDGQTVLIDYEVEVEPAHVTTTLGWRFGIRYDIEEGWLKGAGVYGRYAQQDQTRRNDVDVLLPAADVRDLVLGVDYRVGYLTMLAERQWHDSAISPFRATRLEGRYARPLGRGNNIVFTGTYQDIDRYEDQIQTQIITLGGRWNQQLSEQLRMGVEVNWRDERDRPGVHVMGFEQQLDLSWRYRQTSIFGMLRNANLWSDIRDTSSQTIHIGIRREF